MPTYEYACETCGIVEVFQSMRDDALKKCPTCASKKFSRMISGGGAVIFKGEGFWETDYNRSKDYSAKKKDEASAAKPADPAKKPDGAKASDGAKPEAPKPAAPAPKPQPAAAPAAAKPKPGGGKPAGPAA